MINAQLALQTYLFEMYSFQDVEKIPRVVQLGHENVTTVIATLLCEPRHYPE